MNYATSKFCAGMAHYYSGRQPPDFAAVRGLWARARTFAQIPNIGPDFSAADFAIATCLPGEVTEPLPHREGLSLIIEGEILPSFPVESFVRQIGEAQGPIVIRLNCGGGDLAAAFALHDALRAAGSARVEVLVAGCAGSAATLILAAADRRRVLAGSRLWVHAPSHFAWGNASELRRLADELDQLTPRMFDVYGRIISDREALRDWFDGRDFFFDAPGALAVGLATQVEQPIAPLK